MSQPIIIQGGMGVAVSGWRLARAVAQLGQLGVVSGAILAVVFARRLQAGDASGQMRRAMEHFPLRGVAERVLENYFVSGGKAPAAPFAGTTMPTLRPGAGLVELMVAANFTEVFLAKEGHAGLVGINLLEKVQLPTLPSLYGAMLAGVDYVLMGAGIPRAIPGVLDRFARGEAANLKVDVEGARPARNSCPLSIRALSVTAPPPPLRRPQFLAIVSSATLAIDARPQIKRPRRRLRHRGPHRRRPQRPAPRSAALNARGEPVYGVRDQVDHARFRDGLPFWLAGGFGSRENWRRRAPRRRGHPGRHRLRLLRRVRPRPRAETRACQLSRTGGARVFTDPLASPTGFPFKVMQMEGTLSGADQYACRERICDLGYLRQAYRKPDGTLGYRCAAEPVADFVRKGGDPAATPGRKCLCNALVSTAAFGQVRADGAGEGALITAGDDVANLVRYLPPDRDSYSAADVVQYLLADAPPA